MIRWGSSNTQKGFTLIELLAVVIILSVVTYISITLFNSVKARDQLRETRQRIDLIAAKIKQYYQTHQQLPKPIPEDGTGVPVEALDMEQKYRLDAWGQYLEYHRATHTGQDTDDLVGYEVDGHEPAAVVLISLGPNQTRDYESNETVYPQEFTTGTESDDLLIATDVTADAIRITEHKLKVLQEKVAAYDALFAGIDNNGDGTVDNTSNVGEPADLRDDAPNTCPPTHSFANDPSEGLSTLSAIEETGAYNCPAPVVDHIVKFYGLPSGSPEGYDHDPWVDQNGQFRQFKWGYEGRPIDEDSQITTSDPRYHRFYSSGPDADDSQDDIIFSGN
ncbi:MAG: hypothetical protein SRB2_02544 [Desulfobacteraceae bacterium Eth-SRB2]|nr:MAG: hypothetical protein SRB2_02544 [Desulfobacteraceae bacterium Eth-SRB2]